MAARTVEPFAFPGDVVVGSLAPVTATRLSFLAVALVCAVLGAVLAASSRHEAQLERASADIASGRQAEALAELDGVGGDDGRAARLRCSARFASGLVRVALAVFRVAARRVPNDWVVQRDYAIV
jgi:hypothetical protein